MIDNSLKKFDRVNQKFRSYTKMDEQQLIYEPPMTFCNFFKRLSHHFTHGNAPYNTEVYNFSNNRIPFSFPFDSHPGPVDEAVVDAKNLHRSLFLFIYCINNPLTTSICNLLQKPSIASEIRENFVFLPLDVTWPEGWSVASHFEFKRMPLIAIIRPKGSSLWESKIFVKYEGRVGENTLLSSMRVELHERNPDTEIVEEQNNEFNDALLQDAENDRRRQEEEQQQQQAVQQEENERILIEEQFGQLPQTDNLTNVATIRFQFPDNLARIHKFPRESSVDLLFVFVRKFMFPRKFILITGFPQFQIRENGQKLCDVCPEKNFIIHVEEEE
ncbi:hypothetical protein TRFO_13697 [Tritrichomonas foetus]|uniref:UBX domain-containing protein n=1 Tax=Tritrichomonas foetus TaxID=1144522 RepID=A0A1J4KXG4_9EUKA|nr:hypothetical protein TRFO_13697 [Tritrichomonas foetus]|eukprot:OHT15866.1 hypothetical protein TRFO_13697 [Tritrichomonas foetus]